MDQFTITIALLATLYLFTALFHRKPSNRPPSVFPTIPVIGHLYLLKKPLYRTFATLSAKHGPIILLRFGSRNILLVSSPSAAEECFTKNDIVFANRPHLLFGKILGCNYSNIAWSPYGNHWRNLRRISSIEILSSHRLNEFKEVRAEEGRLLVRKLVSECSSPVNLKSVFNELTLNVIMRMIFGKRYFGSDLGEEGKKFQEIVKQLLKMGDAANLGDHLPILNRIREEDDSIN